MSDLSVEVGSAKGINYRTNPGPRATIKDKLEAVDRSRGSVVNALGKKHVAHFLRRKRPWPKNSLQLCASQFNFDEEKELELGSAFMLMSQKLDEWREEQVQRAAEGFVSKRDLSNISLKWLKMRNVITTLTETVKVLLPGPPKRRWYHKLFGIRNEKK